jgi:hypothetical protein
MVAQPTSSLANHRSGLHSIEQSSEVRHVRSETVDKELVLALASVAGITISSEDLEGVTYSLRRYAEVTAALEELELEEVDPALIHDPRAGWWTGPST